MSEGQRCRILLFAAVVAAAVAFGIGPRPNKEPPAIMRFAGFERDDFGYQAVMYVTNRGSERIGIPRGHYVMEVLQLDGSIMLAKDAKSLLPLQDSTMTISSPVIHRWTSPVLITKQWSFQNLPVLTKGTDQRFYVKPSEDLPWRVIIMLPRFSFTDTLPHAIEERLPYWAKGRRSSLSVTSEWVRPSPALLP